MKENYKNYKLIDFSNYTVREDAIFSNCFKKQICGTSVGSPYAKTKTYHQTRLKCIDGKQRYFYIHVAIWYYFNGEIPQGYEIDHIIPLCEGGSDELKNLRLLTHNDNMHVNGVQERKGNSKKNKSK